MSATMNGATGVHLWFGHRCTPVTSGVWASIRPGLMPEEGCKGRWLWQRPRAAITHSCVLMRYAAPLAWRAGFKTGPGQLASALNGIPRCPSCVRQARVMLVWEPQHLVGFREGRSSKRLCCWLQAVLVLVRAVKHKAGWCRWSVPSSHGRLCPLLLQPLVPGPQMVLVRPKGTRVNCCWHGLRQRGQEGTWQYDGDRVVCCAGVTSVSAAMRLAAVRPCDRPLGKDTDCSRSGGDVSEGCGVTT